MIQTFLIRINNKPYYFYSPLKGQIKAFPTYGKILQAYIKKNLKNSYQVIIAYEKIFTEHRDCQSIKECCKVLQEAYNDEKYKIRISPI